MSDNEPTQPMEPRFYPPPPPWEYQLDLSRRAGANVYMDADDELVVRIDGRWRLYDPDRMMFLKDDSWFPLGDWVTGLDSGG